MSWRRRGPPVILTVRLSRKGCSGGRRPRTQVPAGSPRAEAKLGSGSGDLDQAVVLGDSLAPGWGAGLELPAAGADGQVGDERVLVSPDRWDTICR